MNLRTLRWALVSVVLAVAGIASAKGPHGGHESGGAGNPMAADGRADHQDKHRGESAHQDKHHGGKHPKGRA